VPPTEYADQFEDYFRQKFIGDAAQVSEYGEGCILGSPVNTDARHITVAGEEVWLHNDQHFIMLRKRYGLNDDEWASTDCFSWVGEDFKSGGGKGGDLMAFTSDRRFIVKEVDLMGTCF